MEENLANVQPPMQPAQPVQFQTPVNLPVVAAVISSKANHKTKDFLIGLFFGLGGAIVLALLDLLFIAKANPSQDAFVWFLVFLGPILILGLNIFFWVYFLKRQRSIFWGLLYGFFLFMILLTIVANFLMPLFG